MAEAGTGPLKVALERDGALLHLTLEERLSGELMPLRAEMYAAGRPYFGPEFDALLVAP